jgi:hypothetical protein
MASKESSLQGTKKDYGRFVIEWLDGPPPTKCVSKDRERMIVEAINSLVPKFIKYKEFMRKDWAESGIPLAMDISWPPEAPDVEFDFWYDNVQNRFGLHILDWNEEEQIGCVTFPEEIGI